MKPSLQTVLEAQALAAECFLAAANQGQKQLRQAEDQPLKH